jgi:hypothetical protein
LLLYFFLTSIIQALSAATSTPAGHAQQAQLHAINTDVGLCKSCQALAATQSP